jgi:hypothetical protein
MAHSNVNLTLKDEADYDKCLLFASKLRQTAGLSGSYTPRVSSSLPSNGVSMDYSLDIDKGHARRTKGELMNWLQILGGGPMIAPN